MKGGDSFSGAGSPWSSFDLLSLLIGADFSQRMVDSEEDVNGWPRISVVIPSYNQAEFIERTLRSVIDQGYPNLEIIVIDGGSTDGTVGILEKYRPYLAYMHSGPDRGQSDALNRGFQQATGEIMGWLNSDDVYLPGALNCIARAFRALPDKTVLFGDWWTIDRLDRVLGTHFAFEFNLRHFVYEGFHLNAQAMFWRKEAHQRFGEFDVGLHRTMDYDLILRLGLTEGERRFLRLPRPIACFRRHLSQKTTSAGADLVLKEHRAIASRHDLHWKFTAFGALSRTFYRFRRAWWYLKRGGLDYTCTQFRRSNR